MFAGKSPPSSSRKSDLVHQLFVFGTLKRGFPNYEAGMSGLRFVGRGQTCEAYPLVVAGEWFSPVLIFEAGNGSRVFGELFEVDDAALERLDFSSTHICHRATIA